MALLFGLLFCVLGLIAGFVAYSKASLLLGVLAVMLLVLGVWLLRQGWRKRRESGADAVLDVLEVIGEAID